MRLISSSVAATLAACLLFPLAGCGGGQANSDTLPNRYAGMYRGRWQVPDLNQQGTMRLNIALDGRAGGTLENGATGQTGTLTGSVENDGDFSGFVAYGQQRSDISGHLDFDGERLTADFDQRLDGSLYQGEFNLGIGVLGL